MHETSSSTKKSTVARLLIALALSCFALGQHARAVSPAPDGGYAGGNTAEGTQALQSLTSGLYNTALGYQALFSNSSGYYNSAEGFRALYSNTSGTFNTATGVNALYHNTTGRYNEAYGVNALFNNTTGNNNAANGTQALFSNTTGSNNTGSGVVALYNNTIGTYNAANGCLALYSNTTGSFNAANGAKALYSNTTGEQNTASGYQALYSNTGGGANTASGYQALYSNTTGSSNTASGYQALYGNIDGLFNHAIGVFALFANITGFGNIAIGDSALTSSTGDQNTAVGDLAGDNLTTGSGNVCLGANVGGVAAESNTTRIRNIGNTAQDTAIYVTLDAVGGNKLGYVAAVSSRRYKDEIKPMNKTSEALFALKPVNFRYKPEINPDRAERFGLIAEEVEKINPDLVSHDSEGKPMTVRYESINAMLLNEFLKEHTNVEELKSKVAKQEALMTQQQKEFKSAIAQQRKEMEALVARLKEQNSKIQKVSARLELNTTAPQTVLNNQ